MNTSKKIVLLLQPSQFQAELWRFLLDKHDIFAIWERNYKNKKCIENHFTTSDLKPSLVIIDLKIDNAYELCRWLQKKYPLLKLILTSNVNKEYLSAIRRWSLNQGVDEFLINFDKENLVSTAITNINSVLKALECGPTQKENLIRILESFNKKRLKNITKSSKAIDLKYLREYYQNLEILKKPTISPLMRYLLGFSVIIWILTIVLDISTLWLISPVQELQRKVLFHVKEQKKNPSINDSNLKELDKIPNGIFSYGGSTTWAPIRQLVTPKINEEYPEFNLRYLPAINATPGSGTGIRMLLEGQLDFSQSSRSIEQEEHIIAHQKCFSLKAYHVAIDAIAIAVNPSLQVSGLTVEQLEKIYTGQITNWQEVNGPDLKIIPLSRRVKDGGTPQFFQHYVLENQPFSNNVKYVYSTTDGLRKIKDNPGAIYYGSAPEIVPQCQVKSLPIADKNKKFIPLYIPPAVLLENCPEKRNQINIAAIKNATYPLTRYLSVIVKQDGEQSQKAGEAYSRILLTKEMQKLIEKAGFVPIK